MTTHRQASTPSKRGQIYAGRKSGLSFTGFDSSFLEASWKWLNDPEIKRLTMTPDFSRAEQRRWYSKLPTLKNYLIWGIAWKQEPIGALGLKNLTTDEGEYWGYIGERQFWGMGLGREMVRFALEKAGELGLQEVYLKVHRANDRAIRLYTRTGFAIRGQNGEVLQMRLSLEGANAR